MTLLDDTRERFGADACEVDSSPLVRGICYERSQCLPIHTASSISIVTSQDSDDDEILPY